MQQKDVKLNFEGVKVLALERSPHGLEIITQIFYGFGTRDIVKCTTSEDAEKRATESVYDLMLIEATPEEGDGYDFVKWLRRNAHEGNRKLPVIMISANGVLSSVLASRNAGSNFYLVKPLTPDAVLARVMYILKDNRDFIEATDYAGPDRRVRYEGMPPGVEPRRESDLTEELGKGDGNNMSQDDLDAMFKPAKVSLE